jgi:NADH-quinone oxidoreductase subunit N
VDTEDDLAGLSQSHPGIALMMALFLLSLIGIPLTAGFMGKLFLVMGALAVEGERATVFRWLALILLINAAIGGWYYLRVIAKMYLYPSARPISRKTVWPGLVALLLCAMATIGIGIYPRWVYDAVSNIQSPIPISAEAHRQADGP